MTAYDMETTIQLPDEEDVDVLIEFEVESWGRTQGCPSFSYPGDPPEAPEFYIIKIERANGGDILSEVDTLPEEYRRKIEDLVFEKICDIEADHADYDYEG